MSIRVTNRRRLKKYSIGDMRERITIHTRSITAPGFDDVSITEAYDDGEKYWASVETLDKKKQLFSGVNIPDSATHSFIIRFDSSITSENRVRWEGDFYQILKTSDPDKRQQYLELFSKLLGNEQEEANT